MNSTDKLIQVDDGNGLSEVIQNLSNQQCMEKVKNLKKKVDYLESRGRLQMQIQHTGENAIYNIRTTHELEIGLQGMVNSFIQPKYHKLALETTEFLRSHKTAKTYFLTLYWSLITFFQVFKMSDTKVIKMELSILTSRKNELLQKLSKAVLKASTIALTSVKGAAEGSALIYWIFMSLWKKHEAKRKENTAEGINQITEDILFGHLG